MASQHAEWLVGASPDEIFRWHSARSKADIVQSLCDLIDAVKETRVRPAEAPTGKEEQGFTGDHRLAAFLALAELNKAGVVQVLKEDGAIVWLAQFLSNWERRGVIQENIRIEQRLREAAREHLGTKGPTQLSTLLVKMANEVFDARPRA